MTRTKSLYHGHRFPAAVISQAVRWYFRFNLSLRDIEELLFERAVVVTYETIRRWCDKFGAGYAQRVKAARRKPGSTWHLDEMFVTLRGEPYLLWRAVDEHGAELDILLQKRRDKAAAKRFFLRVLRTCPVPRKIVTDQLRSYPAAKADIPELANVKHVFVKAAARLNNRAENSHQPTRERERRMRGYRDRKRTQAFLSSFGPIRQHFALKRHLLRASLYRKHLAARFAAWHEFTGVTQNPSTAF
ncbi:IS6 family transposase [Cupriavidus sp. CV2]|uniref:IS6 family transposase n=1 Tax=Cupriavidus ulmosensis TaxID=3065913 RepID=UPI00296AF09B|nr:IS6 family transposase [Cupriavidus sp. CV2]MDW3688404.1 IS6 family transposase [Cupriavidus sp. CV2]